MRYIFSFLLLANIAYFAWNYSQSEQLSSVASTANRPLLNTGLTLVDEYQQQLAATTAQKDSLVCSLVGDFLSVDEALSYIMDAENMGYAGKLAFSGELLEPQYRAYMPPLPSLTEAASLLDELSTRLTAAELEIETYLITRGLLESAIALGVFLRREDAELVVSQLAGLGYAAEISEIPQSTGQIQVLHEPFGSLSMDNSAWLKLSVSGRNLSRAENLCETIAQGLQFP